MTKHEKVVSLTKYIEKTKRSLESTTISRQKKEFFEREMKRTLVSIERLR
jgi:hypothetical protein